MMKKVFALLVAVMMLLSVGAAGAQEVTTPTTSAGQIGNYYEVNDTTGALATVPALVQNADKTATQQVYSALFDHDADPETADVNTELVWLNKTIAPTGTENLFDVTLEVITAQAIENVDLTEDAATVLVIDASNSMTNNGSRRLANAKAAANAFINEFKNVKENVARKIAIVKFSGYPEQGVSGAVTVQGWTDASDTTLAASIDGIQTDGGTNIEAGLILAQNLLSQELKNEKTGKVIQNKNIVLLTDGNPTYGVTSDGETNDLEVIAEAGENISGNGQQTSCSARNGDTHKDAEQLCKDLKAAGYGTYAVYVGSQEVDCVDCSLDTNGQGWLQNYCGFATYSTEDAEKLIQIFENISKQIAARAEAWVVTDPMGAQVDYVTSLNLNDNGSSYDADSETLVWDLKTDNTVDDDTLPGKYIYTCKYQICLDTLKAGFAEGTFYPTNDVTPLTWVVLDADGNVTGADQADGGVKKAYFNVPSVQGYMADLTFKKVNDAYAPVAGAEFTVTLTGENGKSWTKTATSEEDGTVTITNIPSGHSYVLSETDVPDKHASADAIDFDVSYGEIDYSGFDKLDGTPIVENVRTEGDAKITVSKAFVGVNESDSDCLPASIDVRLTKKDDNAIVYNVALLKTEDYTAEVIVLAPGWYVVEEVSAPTVVGYDFVKTDYSAKEVEVDIDGSVAVNITNTYKLQTTTATVKKVWDDEGMSEQRPESIIVTLSNGQTVTLNDANGWTATISDLPKYAAGEEIKYTWTEADVDYYALSDEQTEGLVTTLTNSRLTGELSIYKTATEGVTLPDTLTFTVTGPEGFETRTIKYSEFTDGAYHIEGVPTGVYTVTEDTNTADVAYYELDTTNSIVDVETTVTTDGGEAKLHNEYTRTEANVMTVKVNKIVDDSDSDVPAPTEEKVFSFTGKLFRASTNDAVMLADENLVAPETAVISVGGKTFTGNLDEGIDFDFTITSKGSGTYTAPITVKVNAEDLAGLKMTIAEVDDNDSPYWYYNAEAQTLDLKDGMTFEFVNAYLEGRHSLVFPITKTVEQLGNIDPGVNTFYFEVNANYDGAAPAKPVYSIEAVGDSIVQKLSDTKFSITINGAGSAKAKIVVNADNSDMPYSFTIRELAGANDNLTKEELAAKNWNYDPTALDYTIDGEPWNMNWIIQPEDDTWSQVYFIRALNDEADFADEVTFVNQYTANTPPPQTGDDSNIALWIALMGASVLCFVALNKRRSA